MPQIELLDQQTIDKIAAGEVIERPASVVKELVENAIDAKATAITVEIKDGGKSFIRITDNGCGIDKEQVKIAFLRHSTSKIRAVEDLLTVSSLGFRGEALSSISAVSQVELITKTLNAVSGVRFTIEGSKEGELEEIGAPDGTTFIVRNLFFNTPARQKFLKTAVTEAGYISTLMERLALSHGEVAFKFIVNGQVKLQSSGNGNIKDIIYHIYGRDIAKNLIEVDYTHEHFSVSGYIGKPIISRGNRNYENYYINERYIKSNLISKGIEEAYRSFMMQHQYPFTVLYFKINGDLIDVNVHPTKMELRFSNGEEIYRNLMEDLRKSLMHRDLIPEVSVEDTKKKNIPVSTQEPVRPEPFEKKRLEEIERAKQAIRQEEAQKRSRPDFFQREQPILTQPVQAVIPSTKATSELPQAVPASIKATPELPQATVAPTPGPKQLTLGEEVLYGKKLLDENNKKYHRIIGQFLDTYWLVEFDEKLYIIDQHAAHEKVLYERTMASLRKRDFTSQNLCPPIILTLNMQEEALLKQYMPEFEKLGFDISHFGGKEYSVGAVPDNLFGIDGKQLMMDMLDGLSEIKETETSDLILEKVASMSCKAAVKGNNHLSRPEIESLIDELLTLENPYNCPHGRPTIISMTKNEIERKFKRIL